MTQRQPSEATCRALAEAVDEQVRIVHDGNTVDSEYRVRNWDRVRALVTKYRAESAPLRTRAEVDRETAQLVFDCELNDGSGWYIDSSVKARLGHLKREPTAPEPAAEREANPRPPGTTNEAPVYDPALASRASLERIAEALDGTWDKTMNCSLTLTGALMAYRAECAATASPLTDHDADLRDPAAESKRPPIKDCDWCQDDSGVPLRSHRIPASTVMICQRCRDERGITE